MKSEVVLCIDSESMHNPALVGLEGENLLAQKWLTAFCDAEEVRSYVRNVDDSREVWVVSSDNMDAINLAAAIKKDTEGHAVYLIGQAEGGSLKSKAQAAGINAMVSQVEFLSRYAMCKRRAVECTAELAASLPKPHVPAEGRPASFSVSKDETAKMPVIRNAAAIPKIEATQELLAATKPAATSTATSITGTDASTAAIQETRMAQEAVAVPKMAEAHGTEAMPRTAARPLTTAMRKEPSPQEAHLLQNPSVSSTDTQRSPFLLSVVSATGGAGKSTVAALTACFSQGFGCNTLLVDADLQKGDMHRVLGVVEPMRMEDILEGKRTGSQHATMGANAKPLCLAAPNKLEHSEIVAPELPRLIDELGANFNVVVVNTSNHWDEMLVQIIEKSTHVLFVVDQRPSSLHSCKRVLEMCARCGIAANHFMFAVNRCGKNMPTTAFEVSCALGTNKVVELLDGGKDVSELLGAGLPYELIQTRNDLCLSLERLLVGVLPVPEARQAEGTGKQQNTRGRFRGGRRKGRAACL